MIVFFAFGAVNVRTVSTRVICLANFQSRLIFERPRNRTILNIDPYDSLTCSLNSRNGYGFFSDYFPAFGISRGAARTIFIRTFLPLRL